MFHADVDGGRPLPRGLCCSIDGNGDCDRALQEALTVRGDPLGGTLFSLGGCRRTRSGFERPFFRLVASGYVDDITNIACFAVIARRKNCSFSGRRRNSLTGSLPIKRIMRWTTTESSRSKRLPIGTRVFPLAHGMFRAFA